MSEVRSEHLEFVDRVNQGRFSQHSSRRGFLKAALAAGAATAGGAQALGGTTVFAQGASDANIAATAEALAVTYLGAVIGKANLDSTTKAILSAAQYEEYVHYQVLTSALGARPLTTTFSLPNGDTSYVTDKTKALQTIEAAEGLFVNAYLAAVADYASQGNWKVAQYAAEIMGVECEHRVLARVALSESPPNDLAFEQTPISSVAGVAQKLTTLGFLSPSGSNSYAFPGAVSNPGGVTGTAPTNTTPAGPGMPSTGHPFSAASAIWDPARVGVGGFVLGGAAAALVTMLRRRGELA